MTYPWQLHIPGATPADLARAAAALDAHFAPSGITPVEAAHAAWRADGQEMPGAAPIGWTDRDTVAENLWADVESVALAACCSGWAEVPSITACSIGLDDAHVRKMLSPSRAEWIDRCVQRLALRDSEIPPEVAAEDADELADSFSRLPPEYVADMATGHATLTSEFQAWADRH